MVTQGLIDLPRRLGAYPAPPDVRSATKGTLFLLVGGLHGNEPAGVHAIRRVLSELDRSRPRVRGCIVGLTGNRRALAIGERYRTRDLNRVWTREEIRALRQDGPPDDEGREQEELLRELEPLLVLPWRRVVFMDLHSTSADGAPFSIMADTLQNRRVAFRLPIPVILGLEERVDGTLLSYFSEEGYTSVCVEGGQNDLETTIDNHEAALWLSLVSAGVLAERDAPDLARMHARLENAARGTPRVVELRHRQDVPEELDYEMEPGYRNFQHVLRGETLGHLLTEEEPGVERRRPVRTPVEGLVLMPRYQGRGNDAFFVGRRVRYVWLVLSAALRRLRLGFVLPLLPGISRSGQGARVLEVNSKVARWYVLEILHLFGYRRSLREGRDMVFLRRKDAL